MPCRYSCRRTCWINRKRVKLSLFIWRDCQKPNRETILAEKYQNKHNFLVFAGILKPENPSVYPNRISVYRTNRCVYVMCKRYHTSNANTWWIKLIGRVGLVASYYITKVAQHHGSIHARAFVCVAALTTFCLFCLLHASRQVYRLKLLKCSFSAQLRFGDCKYRSRGCSWIEINLKSKQNRW